MANLIPVPENTPVPQIETNTRVLGGPGGPANQQAQALLNRLFLFQENISGPGGSNGVGYVEEGLGAVPTEIQKAVRNFELNLKTFGLALDGSTDDADMWDAAIATGRNLYWPPGGSVTSRQIQLRNGQSLRGSGGTRSYFVIHPSFDLEASGVVRPGTSEPGANIYGIGFRFGQPNQNVREDLIKYPPAIDAHDIPRFYVDQIRIEGSYDGIKATGNCGGSFIGFIEVGSLNVGLEVDGPLDFVHGGHWHFWPFGFTNSDELMEIYYDGIGHAAIVGLCDGFEVGSVSTFRQKISIRDNASIAIPMQITRLQLDGDGARLIQEGGRFNAAQSYSTKSGASTLPTIDVLGGDCELSCHNTGGAALESELRCLGGLLKVNGGVWYWESGAMPIARVEGGTMIINNVQFRAPKIAHSQPHVLQIGGSLSVNNCDWTDAGEGTGVAVYYTTDSPDNQCSGNNFGKWQYGPPNGAAGKYTGNFNTISGDVINGNVVGQVKYKVLTAKSNGSSAAIISHGIVDGNLKVLSANVYFRGASGEMSPGTFVYIDGSNVSVSGPGAGVSVRVCLTYTESVDSAW